MWDKAARLAGNPKVLRLLGQIGNVIRNPGFMPAAGGAIGTVQGGLNDGLAGAIRGGAAGATTGMGLRWGLGKIPPAMLPLGAHKVLGTAVPLAGGLVAGMTAAPSGNALNEGAGQVANTGVIMQQHQPNVSGGYIGGPGGGAGGGYGGGGQGPVPVLGGAHGRMVQGPDGSIWQEIDPTGWKQGMRVGSGLDTQQNISNANRWFKSRFPQSEMVKKADFERELAAKQLGANIEMARTMMEGTHAGNVNIAEQAGADMGQLLNSRYQYF